MLKSSYIETHSFADGTKVFIVMFWPSRLIIDWGTYPAMTLLTVYW